MKKITLFIGTLSTILLTATAQETGKHPIQLSGYLQTQYQYEEQGAETFHRVGIRRGRIKIAHEEGLTSGVIQVDLTEKGIALKDAYLNLKDPWLHTLQLRAGVFNRPFGHEIGYSSSQRESPERSTVFRTLFPDERDLGLMLVLQAPGTSSWHFLKLEAGLFAGNGIQPEIDNRKDFIGHLSANRTAGRFSWGAGVSYYNGGVYQGTDQVYKMQGKRFVADAAARAGLFSRREYAGADAQLRWKNRLGTTRFRAEYLQGQQPGTATSSQSPHSSTLPAADTYLRRFQGGSVLCVQDIGTLPFSAVLKYDWYDPNTEVAGDDAPAAADVSRHTFGFGALWRINNRLRLQAFYEINAHETAVSIEQAAADVLTLRLQYKF
ncbi:MAG: hypothetical protein LBH61_00620 [Dysgonamonadaceae bacterium]|jgi:hypothetical protein|nr:hypothetical protein [Dysgonamonadaceae bacterium]